MVVRIILLLYILPLILISAFSLVFGKSEWLKKIWVYGTFIILGLVIVAKMLFSLMSFME